MLMSSVPLLALTVFHLTVNIQYAYFPVYYSIAPLRYSCLWRKHHTVPRKTAKGLKIKQHSPWKTETSLKWGSMYPISVSQTGAAGRIHSVSLFPEQTEQTLDRVVPWTSGPLSPSAILAGPAFVLLRQRDRHCVTQRAHKCVFKVQSPAVCVG